MQNEYQKMGEEWYRGRKKRAIGTPERYPKDTKHALKGCKPHATMGFQRSVIETIKDYHSGTRWVQDDCKKIASGTPER